MPDRLKEISARLGAWSGMDAVEQSLTHPEDYVADIAWLLDEVERLGNTNVPIAKPLCDGDAQ
jgi:hypothetical protein